MSVLINFLIRVLVAVFFIGLAGSVIVILLSFVEDFRELFTRDESGSESPKHTKMAPPAA